MNSSDYKADRVRSLLKWILEAAVIPGAEALTHQLKSISVLPASNTTMTTIVVSPSAALAQIEDGPFATVPQVVDEHGEPIGELLLWVLGGRIDALEFAWWSDEPPTELPSIDRLRIAPTA